MTILRNLAPALILLGSFAATASAESMATRVATTATAAPIPDMVKIPSTAEEHDAMAESYRKKAAEYRAEAEFHRKMLAAFIAKNPPIFSRRASTENPRIRKMREHCRAFIKDATKLAADADKLADYHHLSAEEMRGK